MTPSQEKWKKRLEPFLEGDGPNSKNEWRTRCPIHGDAHASATTNFVKGVFHCNRAGCGGMHIRTLIKRMDAGGLPLPDDNVSDFMEARERKNAEAEGKDPLFESDVRQWNNALLSNPERLHKFMLRRMLTRSVIEQYEIGYDAKVRRFTIPVRDEDGSLVNVRRYRPDAPASQKVINMQGWGSPPRLTPLDQLQQFRDVLLTEGELDAYCGIAHGFHSVSGTGGASRWDAAWSRLFTGKHVTIIYDNDEEGRVGAQKAARSLSPHAASVRVLEAIVEKPKGDLTDYFAEGGTAEDLRKRIAEIEPEEKPEKGVAIGKRPGRSVALADVEEISVLGSMDASYVGKPVRMDVTITGKKGPSYSVIRTARLTCNMDLSPTKCQLCPMCTEYTGNTAFRVNEKDVDMMARLVDAGDKWKGMVLSELGIKKCLKLTVEGEEHHTLEELFVTGSIDSMNSGNEDYTQRRVYYVGGKGDTPTNASARVTGTAWPNPKDSRQEFFAWGHEPAVTSLEKFEMTPELGESLKIFQPDIFSPMPLDKAREISGDIANRAAKVVGRHRLAMAMDFVFHSVLRIPFQGDTLKGTLEFAVVGETRTGKTKLAEALIDYYGLGHLIGCEGASFAGLVGGVTQVAQQWTVQWGEIPLNDKRLVVLDEVSGLSQEAISQMSGIRSSGKAQLTKVASGITNARCRMIWISNPRKKVGQADDKRGDGIFVLQDLIGTPEDIARFDFAMSVRSADVKTDEINKPLEESGPSRYTPELCQSLILWAWSRKPEQVKWDADAYKHIFECAKYLGKVYVPEYNLIEPASVKDKIARLAVAIAARLFSTDETLENVVVTKDHVDAAAVFLDEIYSYANFGYRRLSDRVYANRAKAEKSRDAVKKYLLTEPAMLAFVLEQEGRSFRADDIYKTAAVDQAEASVFIAKLMAWKMLSRDKSQIVLEPELQSLLREME